MRPATVLEYARFLNPAVRDVDRVGSRYVDEESGILKAEGRRVIPVFGYPVVSMPEHLVEAASRAVRCASSAPSNGLPALRSALAKDLNLQYRMETDPDEHTLICCGAMHGLNVVMTALLQPGDEVLLVSPCYFFGGLITIPGARPVYVEMAEQDGYRLDFERIRAAISDRTKAILISSPVNPTGYVYSCDEVERFIELAREFDLLLVSDESYDRMVYDGREHVSPMNWPEGRERTILVKSFTKSFALPSLRVGYIVAPAELVVSFRKVLEWMMLTCPTINQHIALAAMQGPQAWLDEALAQFPRRRDQLMEGLGRATPFTCPRPHGGPFVFLNVSGKSTDADAYAVELLRSYGIPAVPGKYFQVADRVRVPFGGSPEAVAELITALAAAASS